MFSALGIQGGSSFMNGTKSTPELLVAEMVIARWGMTGSAPARAA
jgi:hypothetical protein